MSEPLVAVSTRCSALYRTGEHTKMCVRNAHHEGDHEFSGIPDNRNPTPTVLEEAARLTSEDRHQSYGHPLENFSDTAYIITGILHAARKLDRAQYITADEAQLIMMAVKLARLARDPLHRDSQIDLAGYVRTLEMTQDKRAALYSKG